MKIKKPRTKDEARQIAIEYQQWISERDLSYSELIDYQQQIYDIGKRFGLIREFKENGVL